MTPWQQFAVSLFGAVFPWITLWCVMKYFLLAGSQFKKANDCLLASNADLTAQVMAFKNPWAAEQFARFKALSEQAPKPDTDNTLEDQMARHHQEIDEQQLE